MTDHECEVMRELRTLLYRAVVRDDCCGWCNACCDDLGDSLTKADKLLRVARRNEASHASYSSH